MMLEDAHCHLDWFLDTKRIVENYQKENVEYVLSNATSFVSIQNNLALAKKFPSVLLALGLHPENVLVMTPKQIRDAFALIKENISLITAVGEVGLDFKYADTNKTKQLQEKVFRDFISLAIKHDKPIVVHARYAESQTLEILEEMNARKVLMHWYTNSKRLAKKTVGLGYFISCGPIIFSDAQSASVVKEIPLENLMLETDAPVPFEGRGSEPSWIPKVCEKVASIKGILVKEVEEQTTANFRELFL